MKINPRPYQPSSGQMHPLEKAEILDSVEHEHVKDELLLRLRPQADVSKLQEHRVELVETFRTPADFNGQLVRVKVSEPLTEAMEELALDPNIEYAVPNHVYRLDRVPNDLDNRLWGLRNEGQEGGLAGADIGATQAWEHSTGGGPLIAVIDSGIDHHHPDLANNVYVNPNEVVNGEDDDGNGVIDDVRGYNALQQSGDAVDGHGHGSHVAGTIGAEGDNAQGVVGVNWQAEMLPVKIFSDQGRTTADAVLRGVLYAGAMGARITSNSWGGGGYNRALKDAFGSSKALHIAAAGNDGRNNDLRPHYPSNYDLDNIVAVAASDRNDQLASFSNYGAESVDVTAPGVEILSTVPGAGYEIFSGTSMATPHVSGAAALIVSAFPEATNEEIKTRLMWSGQPLEALESTTRSGSRLNVARALEVDAQAPAAPGDLRFEDGHLRWTSTGDDGWCGRASAYDLRSSREPMTVESFAAAGGPGLERALNTGEIESHAVMFPPSGQDRTYHFGLRVMDNVGNFSDLRQTEVTVAAVPVAFEDDADGEEAPWEADGDWKRVEVPGRGRVWTETAGSYEHGSRGTLLSHQASLEGFQNSKLHLDVSHHMERFRDYVFLEVSSDGEDWDRLKDFTGESDWQHLVFDLSQFDGRPVQVRLRTWTSEPETKTDGFYLDNVVVTGDPV